MTDMRLFCVVKKRMSVTLNFMTNTNDSQEMNSQERSQRIDSLRDMISSAEKTIQGAKAMLLQLEGKKRVGRRHKAEEGEDGSTIVQGTFDGQIMLGSDGKQYPVPANYASKSKLVEGDMLKLTITADGSFIYKQIGPIDRRHALGIVMQDENGNFYVLANGKPYRILLASVTYFRAEPGDEAAIVLPRDIDPAWAALENIVAKAKEHPEILEEKDIPDSTPTVTHPNPNEEVQENFDDDDAFTQEESLENETSQTDSSTLQKEEDKDDASNSLELLEEWQADIEEIERELEKKKEVAPSTTE